MTLWEVPEPRRTWNPASEEYNGLPVFIDTASIEKVEVI